MSNAKTISDITAVKGYLTRIGATIKGVRRAVVEEPMVGGYWKDKAIISFATSGEVTVYPENPEMIPTKEEAAAIAEAFKEIEWPKSVKLEKVHKLPNGLGSAPAETIIRFHDEKGHFIFLQHRLVEEDENGEEVKRFVPWTFFSDGEWRAAEPDGRLPLWGLEALRPGTNKVAVHEGAGAARKWQEMVEGKTKSARDALAAHPWAEELKEYVHLGWIGGAKNPQRTDWKPLKKAGVKEVLLIADNDRPGIDGAAGASKMIECRCEVANFGADFPKGWDLGDPMPEVMFKAIGEEMIYTGPPFRTFIYPQTWATDLEPIPGSKKMKAVLREEFREEWYYCQEPAVFVQPRRGFIFDEKQFNIFMASHSHSQTLAKLIYEQPDIYYGRLGYQPGQMSEVSEDSDFGRIVNMWKPSTIRPRSGDPAPWLEFMEYLVPLESERNDLLRWIATLVARPKTRMLWGVLLVSETQGTGKTTLGETILAPLIGHHNVSFPTERAVVDSQFNSWQAMKRLAVINEFYHGHSWKAYNVLKSSITDKFVDVNEKFRRPYRIKNHIHVFASSNSMRALKMEDTDRRWFYPTLTEVPWPVDRFAEFRAWLASGGLCFIHQWALDFETVWGGKYVGPEENAPTSGRKKELIEESRSEAKVEAINIAQVFAEKPEPAAIGLTTLRNSIKEMIKGQVHELPMELGKAMVEENKGRIWRPKGKFRTLTGAGNQTVVVNNPAWEKILELETEDAAADFIRQIAINPLNLVEGAM